jgi:thiamine pyrophosphokinase
VGCVLSSAVFVGVGGRLDHLARASRHLYALALRRRLLIAPGVDFIYRKNNQ